YLFVRGDDRNPDKSKPMAPGVPEVLGGSLKMEAVKLPLQAYVPDKREFVIQEEKELLVAEFEKATRALETAVREAHRSIPTLLSTDLTRGLEQLGAGANLVGLHLAGRRLKLAEARLVAYSAVIEAERLEDEGKNGTPPWEAAAKRAVEAQQKALALEGVLAKSFNPQLPIRLPDKKAAAKQKPPPAQKPQPNPTGTNYIPRSYVSYPATSSGRRLAFACWLTDRSNPLTARVAMNHIWMRHFGQAIVPSVTDFGRNGRPPSHPALLDWLAVEFMQRGWSMKQMHRLIVTSNTYRMTSTPDDANLATDRDNVYLWRMNSRRLEAEVVRDCIFYVSGKLDLKMGGPDIPHKQGLTTPRRSIYFQHAQEKQMEFLKIFDAAAVTECYRRKESVV